MPAANYQKGACAMTDIGLDLGSCANTTYFNAMSSRTSTEKTNDSDCNNASSYPNRPETNNNKNFDGFKNQSLRNEIGNNMKLDYFKGISNPTVSSDNAIYKNSNYENGQLAYKALERESTWRVVELDSVPIGGYEHFPVCSSFHNNKTYTYTTNELKKPNFPLCKQENNKSSHEILLSESSRMKGDSNSITSLRKYFESEPKSSDEKRIGETQKRLNSELNQSENELRAGLSYDSLKLEGVDRMTDIKAEQDPRISVKTDLKTLRTYVKPNDTTKTSTGRIKSTDSKHNVQKYVSLSTVVGLGDKIRKLREDMMELRSTTTDFQNYMGRMFNELSVINQFSWSKWPTENLSTLQTYEHAKPVAIKCLSKMDPNVVPDNELHQSNLTYLHGTSHYNGEETNLKNSVMSSLNRSVDLKAATNKGTPDKSNTTNLAQCRKNLPNVEKNHTKDFTDKDNLRLIPILNHRHKALHTSECSIDSGYQDSSWHSPRQSRELASQVVTPASPINEYPNHISTSTNALKQNDNKTDNNCKPSYTETLKKENISNNNSNTAVQESLTKEQFIVSESRHRSDSYHSIISSDSSKVERPIPKQRTKFIFAEKDYKESIPEATLNHMETEPVFYSEHTTEICDKNQHNCSTELSQTPSLDQQTNTSTVSVQKRIKLGVSAINLKQNDDSNKKMDFGVTRNLKSAFNKKQKLREKFSDIMKRSAAKNNAESLEEEDMELSQVRRRSMRMMTEFQIFDMKDAVINLNQAFSVANKCDTLSTKHEASPKIPPKTLIQDEVSPQKCNIDKVHTYENVEIIAKEPKQIKQNKQLKSLIAYSEEINQTMEDNKHAKNMETRECRSSTPQKHQHELSRSLSISSSQSSIFTEIELSKQVSTCAPTNHVTPGLLRPKPGFAGTSDLNYTNITPIQYNNVIGLKISSSERSAFTPVLSSSMRCLHQQNPSTIAERYDVPFSEIESGKHEYKQTSLPLSAVRKKRNFIKELAESVSVNSVPVPVTNTTRPNYLNFPEISAFVEKRRMSIEESVISTEHSFVTSFKMNTNNLTNKNIEPSSPSSVFSKGSGHERRRNKSNERKQNVYVEPVLQKIKQEPENVSVFTDSPQNGVKDQNAFHHQQGKIVSNTNYQNTKPSTQPNDSVTQPFANYNAFLQDPLLSVRGRRSKGQKLSSRSNIPQHEQRHQQQSDVRHSQKDLRHQISQERDAKARIHKRDPSFIDQTMSITSNRNEAEPKKTSRKSAVALIRASFIGKKEKPGWNQIPENKTENVSKSKPRSSSLTSKKNNSTTAQIVQNKKNSTSLMGAATKKEIKPKSMPHFGRKSKQDEGSSLKKDSKESKTKNKSVKNLDSFLPSESSPRGHGNPDSEIMDRFLRSEPAPNNNVRSHLQRLRSSFRAPRNKVKIQSEARYKDDMMMESFNVGENPSKSLFGIRQDRKTKIRQDAFTYV